MREQPKSDSGFCSCPWSKSFVGDSATRENISLSLCCKPLLSIRSICTGRRRWNGLKKSRCVRGGGVLSPSPARVVYSPQPLIATPINSSPSKWRCLGKGPGHVLARVLILHILDQIQRVVVVVGVCVCVCVCVCGWVGWRQFWHCESCDEFDELHNCLNESCLSWFHLFVMNYSCEYCQHRLEMS